MDISHLNGSSSAAGAGPCSGPGTLTVGTACPGAGPASSAALTAAAPSSASREGHRRSPPRPRCFRLRLHPPPRHCSRRRRHPRQHLRELGRARVNGEGRGRRPGAGGAPSARPPRHSPRRAPPTAARSSCTSGASSSTTRSCSSLRAARSPRSWAASPSAAAGYGTRTVRVRPSRPRSSATRSRPGPGSGSVSAARSAITARRSCARPAGHVRAAPPRRDTPPTVTWGARHSASAVAPPGASSGPRFPPRFALLGLRVPAMEAAAPEGAEPGSGGSGAEEPVVSLAEVLAENEELEKEARAVLGGSDHERCSYSQVGAGPGASGPGGGAGGRGVARRRARGGAWSGGAGPGGAAQCPAPFPGAPHAALGRSVSPAGRGEAAGAVRLQHLHTARRRARGDLPGLQLRVPRHPPPLRALHQEVRAGGGSGRVGASQLPWLPISCWELFRIRNPACSRFI